jgi:hypothetical protein
VVVDDINGSLHQTLDARPEATYLMDTDGTVAFRALWAHHERVLRQVLQAIVSGQPSPLDENQEKLIPMLEGMGVMYEILGFAGKPARRDVAREVPPMYGIAHLAALFRPLPPLGRSLAAITSAMVGMLALIASVRRLLTAEGITYIFSIAAS